MKSGFQVDEGVGPWWIVSFLLHAALFGALIFFLSREAWKPPSTIETPAASTASPEKVKQVADDIRTRESEVLRSKVKDLLRLKEQMTDIQKKDFERLNDFLKANAPDAEKRLPDAQKRALAAETEAAKNLAAKQINPAADKQAQAVQAQNEALQELNSINKPGKANAVAAQNDALKKQQDAIAAREAAIRALQQAQANDAHVADIDKQLAAAQQAKKAAQAVRDAEAAQVASIRDRDIAVAAKTAAADAQALAAAKDAAAKQDAGNRKNQDDQKVAALQQTLQQHQNTLAQHERELADAGAHEKQIEADSKTAHSGADGFDTGGLHSAMSEAVATQAAAMDSQQHAAAETASVLDAAPGSYPAPTDAQIDSASTIPEIYDTARHIEDAITGTYQDARAAQLAEMQHLPLDQARNLTQTTRPIRPDLDNSALTGPVDGAAGLEQQEEQIFTAQKEIGGMVSLAQDIVDQSTPDAGGDQVSVAGIEARGAHESQMESAALADAGTPARDLSSMMKQGNGIGGGQTQNNSPNPGVADAGPPQVPGDFKAVPGRRLTSGPAEIEKGKDGSWMFLDSWYLIGPWPNEQRRNLNTKFPPESIINLDATYQTETGRRLAWHFYETPDEEVVPPGIGEYEIYYGYTELWSETARDVWIAVGSDDQSKIWVNDELVWKSSDILKGWIPGEGLRRIHLDQGNNRILVRLENGWGSGGFSVLVKVGDSR